MSILLQRVSYFMVHRTPTKTASWKVLQKNGTILQRVAYFIITKWASKCGNNSSRKNAFDKFLDYPHERNSSMHFGKTSMAR